MMSFGLANAPATFQAVMNEIFRHVLHKFVLVFFDDVFVYSHSWEAHMENLRQVFELLRAHCFVANMKKCLFGRTSVE